MAGRNGRRAAFPGRGFQRFQGDGRQGPVQQDRQPDTGLLYLLFGNGFHVVLIVLPQVISLVLFVPRIDRVPGDGETFQGPKLRVALPPVRGILPRHVPGQPPGQVAGVPFLRGGVLLDDVVPEMVEVRRLFGSGAHHEPHRLAVAARVMVVGAMERLVQISHEVDQVHERDLLVGPRGLRVLQGADLVRDAGRHAIVLGAIVLKVAGGGVGGDGNVDVMPGLGVGRALDEEGAAAVDGAALDVVGAGRDVVQPDVGAQQRAELEAGQVAGVFLGDEGHGLMPEAGPGKIRAWTGEAEPDKEEKGFPRGRHGGILAIGEERFLEFRMCFCRSLRQNFCHSL